MRRLLAVTLLGLLAATPAVPPQALPPGAKVVVTQEADLTGDGAPELIVGYTLPREGRPPTEGRSAVLERTARGYRRTDLEGVWPGHYPPRFTVRDMTGDGRPDLVRQVAVGAALQMLSVFQRQTDGRYTALLHVPAVYHLIWDADGDGIPEVLASQRIGNIDDRYTQSIRWRNGRYVKWHAFKWHYGHAEGPAVQRDLVGKSLTEAGKSPLGMIVPVDSAAPAGQVLARRPEGPEAAEAAEAPAGPGIHIAIAAGSTQFAAAPFPGVADVRYVPPELHDSLGVPAGSTPSQRRRWDAWLAPQLAGARQIVHTTSLCDPAYIFRLKHFWPISAGGRSVAVSWLGISDEVPCRGLIFLAEREGKQTPLAPEFTTAIYTEASAPAPVPPQARPLARYLREEPELEAFVTLAPESWAEALRLRGIAPDRWPEPDQNPPLKAEAAGPPDPLIQPDPDHAMITVLNGYVKGAHRSAGTNIWVDIAPAPGRVHRWPLPLTGFAMGMTPYVHILGPSPLDFALHTPIPITSYSRAKAGLQSSRQAP